MARVLIYTRKWCGYCSRAKKLLQEKRVPYEERDATGSAELRQEMVRHSRGRNTFPQIFIDGRHIGGCDDLLALERAGQLDVWLAGEREHD